MTTLYDERRKGRKVAADAVYLPEIEPPAKGRRILTDKHREAPRGFGVRVQPSGTRTFVLRYESEGKDRLLTIGEWPTWTLTAAREKAKDYRREIDDGHDIVVDRRAARAEPTVTDACERFIAHKRRSGMKSADDVEAVLRRELRRELGQTRLKAVGRRDVIALVETLAESKPRQASKLLAYIKQLFAWAEDREIIEANPVATLRADKVSAAMVQRPRARVLDDDEIKALWNGAETVGLHRLTGIALKLVLLTGQRSGEVAGMSEDEIEGKTWTIPAERRKTGTAHTVPLCDSALELIQAARAEADRLAKRRKKRSDYLFDTGRGEAITVAALARGATRYRKALGNKGPGYWTPHDLRRTCRTGLAAAGVSETVAEAVIGHTRQGIVAVYDRHRYEREKRKALETWERRLLRIAAGEPVEDDNVHSIAEAGA